MSGIQADGSAMDDDQAAQAFLWEEFLRHLEFLQATGFVNPDNRLTEDGLWASQLRIDQPLLVAEGLRRELFPQHDPVLLAAVMASLVNEKDTDDHLDKKSLPRDLVRAMSKDQPWFERLCQIHANPRICRAAALSCGPRPRSGPGPQSDPWEKTVKAGQTTEGDLAMLVLRTADHLRHLAGLKNVFPAMAESARQAVDLILRDPVMPDRPGSDPTLESSMEPEPESVKDSDKDADGTPE